jgi:hypothetical protein
MMITIITMAMVATMNLIIRNASPPSAVHHIGSCHSMYRRAGGSVTERATAWLSEGCENDIGTIYQSRSFSSSASNTKPPTEYGGMGKVCIHRRPEPNNHEEEASITVDCQVRCHQLDTRRTDEVLWALPADRFPICEAKKEDLLRR